MFDIEEVERNFNRYIATRKRLDVSAVYECLKDRYPLVLTNTFSLENGKEDYDDDLPVLCGKCKIGSFVLYDDGLYPYFEVDMADGTFIHHWHPNDVEEAVEDVIKFMEGTHEYCV